MKAVVILLLFVLAVVFVLLLPVLSGVAELKVKKPKLKKQKSKVKQEKTEAPQGYLSPDELRQLKQSSQESGSKLAKLKKNLNVKKTDIPLQFSTAIGQQRRTTTQLRKRFNAEDSRDPSAFDYDLDDLIRKEALEDEKERLAEQERLRNGSQNNGNAEDYV